MSSNLTAAEIGQLRAILEHAPLIGLKETLRNLECRLEAFTMVLDTNTKEKIKAAERILKAWAKKPDYEKIVEDMHYITDIIKSGFIASEDGDHLGNINKIIKKYEDLIP